MKINWEDINTVELLYPEFRKYVREHLGYPTCPDKAEVELWYRFKEFIEMNEDRIREL